VAAHGRMVQPPRLLASQLECAAAGWTPRHGLIGSDQVRRKPQGRLSITALAIKAWPARPYRRFAARGRLSGSRRA
jgi:hypothetical protein